MAQKFIDCIKKINPNCNFKMVCIYLNDDTNDIFRSENYLKILIKKSDNFDPKDWTSSYIDWKKIFSDIEAST